jgi:hypothetical protein
VARLIGLYITVMFLGFGAVFRFWPGHGPPLAWLGGAAAGAVVTAAIQIGINARYMWANHTEAKSDVPFAAPVTEL